MAVGVMPDRATILAATPKCPTACGAVMTWHHGAELWVCPRHGTGLTARSLLAQQSTVVARPQPAAS